MTSTIALQPETRTTSTTSRSTLRISRELEQHLRCPSCRAHLEITEHQLTCTHCRQKYPVLNGIAALIDESSSVAIVHESLKPPKPPKKLRQALQACLPTLDRNRAAQPNLDHFRRLLLAANSWPLVLVIGGAHQGVGMGAILQDRQIEFIESDIRLTDRTSLLCDGHRLPFEAAIFDGVIIQAVLEHVACPETCVAEIHRVLKSGGLVYAETAFMQQVHAGAHDFSRFTMVGHRRLFRDFRELAAGATAGPAVALAWSWQHFLLSFTTGRAMRIVATVTAALTAFWLKYLDCWLLRSPAAVDAASAFFFLGERQTSRLTDRHAIQLYCGAQRGER